MDKVEQTFQKLALSTSMLSKATKIVKPFSSAKGNDTIIKSMQKGLGFDIAKANEAIAALKAVPKKQPKAIMSAGSQAGVLKLGELDKAEQTFQKLAGVNFENLMKAIRNNKMDYTKAQLNVGKNTQHIKNVVLDSDLAMARGADKLKVLTETDNKLEKLYKTRRNLKDIANVTRAMKKEMSQSHAWNSDFVANK